ncbi:hypothetical protein L596_029521 [Steinernema carpocapsae]|uniref:Uncharacterized protein n=1 Tax=Steinernema carpocapsae TaxID=34508 RepID=A0A4U5LUW0_STECR|nr:hypothetical protein L596_029521 [Steinernema carpocapsae]
MAKTEAGSTRFTMKIPRNCRGSTKKATIVIFSDASKVAQAACAYLLTDQGCHLIFARSKIHDVTKQQTIPKVEMNAATIGARMSLTIGNELRAKCDIERVILFTDSEIALKWIRSREEPTAGAMVVNRWREIRKIEAEWKNHDVPVEIGYIRTDKNPADCASRGINKDDLGAHIWWNGPAFLRLDESNWPGENKVERLPAETSVVLALSSSIEDNPIEEADHRPLIYQMRLHALRIRFFRNLVSMANEKRKTPIPLKWIKTGKLSAARPNGGRASRFHELDHKAPPEGLSGGNREIQKEATSNAPRRRRHLEVFSQNCRKRTRQRSM